MRGLAAAMVLGGALGSTACVDRALDESQLSATRGDGASGDDCEVDEDCKADNTCFEGICVQQGAIRISLSWQVVSDFDLHVLVPDGEVLNFAFPERGYGGLDVDDCINGECRDPDGVHVENVFLREDAPRGRYRAWVVNFDGRAAGEYRVEVAGDVDGTWTGRFDGTPAQRSEVVEFTWD